MVRDALDAGARAVVLKDGSPENLLAALDSVAAGEIYIDPQLPPNQRDVRMSRLARNARREGLLWKVVALVAPCLESPTSSSAAPQVQAVDLPALHPRSPHRDSRRSVALPTGSIPAVAAPGARASPSGPSAKRTGTTTAGSSETEAPYPSYRRRRLPGRLPPSDRGSPRDGPRRGPAPYRGPARRRNRLARGRCRHLALLAGAAAVDLGLDVREGARSRLPGDGLRAARRVHAAHVPQDTSRTSRCGRSWSEPERCWSPMPPTAT